MWWQFAGWNCFFQCSLLGMLPRMSLSHHNTLYLKQPLQKATRFIPMRQLELPIRLGIVVCFGHGPCRDPRRFVFSVFLIRLNQSFPNQISTLNHAWFGYCWFSWWSITMYNVLQWIATPFMVCFIPLLIYHYFTNKPITSHYTNIIFYTHSFGNHHFLHVNNRN